MSDKLDKFEQQLAQLRPSSAVDQDRLIFEAGRAHAMTDRSSAARTPGVPILWKWTAIAASLVAVSLAIGFAATYEQLNQSRQREFALRRAVRTVPQDADAAQSQDAVSDFVAPRFDIASLHDAGNSQFSMRRQALSQGAIATQERKAKRSSQPVSFGDTRRVLAMVGESQVGLRRIETLRPQ